MLGAFVFPPPEATPDQPLPDAGLFLRAFSGTDQPTTTMQRCAQQLIGLWREVFEHGRNVRDEVHELLALITFAVDREADGHIRGIEPVPDAPENPSSYGEMVSWMAWKYVLLAMRQDQPEFHARDDAECVAHIKAFDQMVADVRSGGLRLPEKATDVWPPKTARPRTRPSQALSTEQSEQDRSR
ncbi:hypothetical protein [Nocardia abscessus]|uniref:hypothetical protein n=1 Tax=Nocardia abscessus TaxID=120957 RepID=UPI0024545873|nr:hypothetical protein [Nocardia abscessus]